MRLVLSALFLLVAGCSQVMIDKKLYADHLTKKYSSSRQQCLRAVEKALKQKNTGIWKKNAAKGEIITNEVVIYDSNFQLDSAGDSRFTSSRATESGQSGQGSVSHTESHQMHLKVSGGAKNCTVQVSRYRYWRDGEEKDKLHLGWHQENVWGPFFAAIEKNLKAN